MQTFWSTVFDDSSAGTRFGQLARAVGLLATLVLLFEAGYFLLTGLLEIINFGWRQPMFDQYKMYPHYLEFAFPENIIQLENGHRPLLPILITLAEIRWMGANQTLHITVGAVCASVMATIPALAAWRQRAISMPMRAAAVAVAVIGIFWLANARMLLHGNELLHVYLPGTLVLLGALCVHRASLHAPVRWMTAATILCTGATFCFGAGVAAFPAIALVAWVSGVSPRAIGMLVVGLAVSLAIYLFVLPGDDGVRQMLQLRPVDSIATAARWIGSPWVNAWLGFADPPLYHWMAADNQARLPGSLVSSSANGIQQLFGISLRMTGSLILGLAGLFLLAIALLKRALRRGPVSAIENVALTMALFGAAISVLIGVGRLDHMIRLPDDIFADRYLPWSCTFWIGIAILALLRLDRARLALKATTIALAIVIPGLLLPSHRSWAGWGEAVYKNSQASAAAALSDVFDPRIFPNDASASHEDVVHTLDLLRQNRLAMFAGPEAGLMDSHFPLSTAPNSSAVVVYGLKIVHDEFSDMPAARFDVFIADEIRWVRNQGPMVVLDPENRVRGIVLPSFIDGQPSGPRLKRARKRGYTGYIKEFSSSRTYRLALLDPDLVAAIVLAEIPSGQ
ncbi:hypothetical protein [Dokdonella sp.]|uniref:hypothetical protein n=1 Tax=Dokdonella sp. TaxID=2291710 RepID=UPI003C50421A